jgi:hypothetical protein
VKRRMASSAMLRRVVLVRTDVSEELSTSLIRVTRIGELGTTLAVTSNRRTSSPILVAQMKEALSSFEASVHTRATLPNIPEDAILHSHRRENLRSYVLVKRYSDSLFVRCVVSVIRSSYVPLARVRSEA